jgi:hypothetical protein
MSWADFFLTFNPSSLTITLVFGVVFGATYGWQSGGGATLLAILGVGSTIILGFATELRGDAVVWERVIARALLWLLLCAALPVGRRIRLWIEIKRAAWQVNRHRGPS